MDNQHSDSEDPFFQEGQLAAMQGFDISENPYTGKNQRIFEVWNMGWRSTGKKEVKKEFQAPRIEKVEYSQPSTNHEIGIFSWVGPLFGLIIFLGALFIFGVIVLAVIKWAFATVF